MNFNEMTRDELVQYISEEKKKYEFQKILEIESLDIDKVYKTSLDLMISLDNVDMGFIYIIDHKSNNAVLKASINVPEDYIKRAGIVPHPKGVTWKVINERKVVNLHDIQKDKDIGEAGKAVGHHRVLGIPIIFDDAIIGVIFLASYKKGKFTDQEIEFNISVANLIGLAVARAKLYDDLSRSNRYQNIIANITSSIHQSIELNQVLRNITEALVNNVEGVQYAAVYMLEGEDIVLKVHNSLPDWFTKRLQKVSNKKGFISKTINKGHLIYVPDVDQDNVIGPAGKKLGIRSYVSIPITGEGRNIGAISMTSSLKNVFDEQDIDLLTTLTKQIEIAISNAHKAKELQEVHVKLEKRVRERTAQLKNSNNELRQLAQRLQSIREEEILHISHELHDDLGQVLTGLNFEFSMLANKLICKNQSPALVSEYEVNSIKKIIELALQKVKKISTKLRPAILDKLGLVSALEWHIQEFRNQTGIDCDFKCNLAEKSFDEKESIVVYRILQESMTNIVRHAKATKVAVCLHIADGSLILEITDNGVGIQKNKITHHKSIGLQGMRERAMVLGGDLLITAVPKRGTDVKLLLPILSEDKCAYD